MSEQLEGVPAVAVVRGPRVESIHAAAVCVCDADGRVALARGTIDVPVYLRSAAKPFIAAAAVRAGAVEAFGLEPHELAVMAASHAGEPDHVATVAGILAKIGATEHDLRCGHQYPGESQLRHNCSGKHAGILALARLLDAPFAGYVERSHPAQQAILALCERAFADRFGPDRIGVDGCGIPVIAVSLRRAAAAFARFATLDGLDDGDAAALERIRAAMLAHPWHVAGTGQFDTDLMTAGGGSLVAKGGAEGVHATALRAPGLGAVLKIVDGTRRAVPPATVALLERLEALRPAAVRALARHARPALTNVVGNVVGELVAYDGAEQPPVSRAVPEAQ